MNRPDLHLSEEDGQEALRAHLHDKALEARAKHGPRLDPEAMRQLISDPTVVRYPTRVVFDAEPLRPGEFGWARPRGETPHSGFDLVLHPALESRPGDWPLAAAYHLVTINYLDVATSAEAEIFGATLFGLTVDEYYGRLCALADGLPGAIDVAEHRLPGDQVQEPDTGGASICDSHSQGNPLAHLFPGERSGDGSAHPSG